MSGSATASNPSQSQARAGTLGVRTGKGRPVLELDNVTKIYPGTPPVRALREVSLQVTAGELVAIVGPSGSGKTTLLHIAGSLDRPTTGTVRVTGLEVAALSDRQLAVVRATRIGFVYQEFFLADHATAIDNVADGLLYGGVAAAERRHQASVALECVGLGSRAHARPTQLSGGERQRVAIARALVGRPAIVLADEPTGNLDSATGQTILALFAELHADGITIVVITHDREVASQFPRRVEMLDGHVVSDTTALGAPLPAPPPLGATNNGRGHRDAGPGGSKP